MPNPERPDSSEQRYVPPCSRSSKYTGPSGPWTHIMIGSEEQRLCVMAHNRCCSLPVHPLHICGSEAMSAQAAEATEPGDACILPPHVIENIADAEAKQAAALKSAFEKGTPADLEQLTAAQLKTLAKQNGVSVARTKAEHLALLDQAEPGIDHSDLTGAALQAKLKQHKIGALRSKQELAQLLAQKQSALQQAKIAAQQMAETAPLPDPAAMPVSQLKEIAKTEGISLNMTKQDTIELLDKIEPGVDHSGLSGKDLAAAKKKHGIGVLKNKQQLVEALQKKAGPLIPRDIGYIELKGRNVELKKNPRKKRE